MTIKSEVQMHIISHRINTIDQLLETPPELGVEVDIRTLGSDLIIHHEPFQPGIRFADWIESYHHNFIILNTKEEGLENRLIELMRIHDIEDYFFLDQSFPFLVKTSNEGESRCAVRVSEYEDISTALTLAGKVDWVWVDCFTKFPLERDEAEQLMDGGFKTCLVAPELQGRFDISDTSELQRAVRAAQLVPNAVCTKFPDRWIQFSVD